MKRRPFIELLGLNLISFPLLSGIKVRLNHGEQWQAWLQQLVASCGIEKVHHLLCLQDLPDEPDATKSGEFSSASGYCYFYQDRQYYFTVYEKYHSSEGLLEIMIPFWKKDSDGAWKKLTCLSLFQLEALAKAIPILAKSNERQISDYLLPLAQADKSDKLYATATGTVHVVSKVGERGVMISIGIQHKQTIFLQDEFRSCHCLTCQA